MINEKVFTPLVSVIVPVYNAENYIERCTASILHQGFLNLELILINDGSTDRSAEICDQIAAKDGRVRVIQQQNAGVSAARNRGIDIAVGKYLQFVDADDWLEKEYSCQLFHAAENEHADIVIAGYQTMNQGIRISRIPPGTKIGSPQNLAKQFDRFYFSMMLNSPCNKIYLREMVHNRFPVGVSMGEDLMFNMRLLEQVERVSVISCDGYIYEQSVNGGSAHTRFVGNGPEEMLAYCDCILPFLNQWLSKEETSRIYNRIIFHCLCNNLNTLARAGTSSRESVRAYLKNAKIQRSIAAADLHDFPREKQIVGFCLRRQWNELARLGIQVAAKKRWKIKE